MFKRKKKATFHKTKNIGYFTQEIFEEACIMDRWHMKFEVSTSQRSIVAFSIQTTSFPIRSIFVISYWNLLPTLLAQKIPLLLEHQGILPGQLSQAFLRG